jgi:CheY-like chemotaxis protein
MSKPLVLVIDDEQLVADTFAMILNVSGFEAVAAYSGDSALELAKKSDFQFVVSDVVMQPMNGIEAAIEICRLLPNCKVFLVSGNNDTAVLLEQAKQSGRVFTCLPKPVHPTLLLDALRTAA